MPGSRSHCPPRERFRELHRTDGRIVYSDGAHWIPGLIGWLIRGGVLGVVGWAFVGFLGRFAVRCWEFGWYGLLWLAAAACCTAILGRGIYELIRDLPEALTRRQLELFPQVRTALLRSVRPFGGGHTETLDPNQFAAVQVWTAPWETHQLVWVGLVSADGSVWNADGGCDSAPIRKLANDLAATLRLPIADKVG